MTYDKARESDINPVTVTLIGFNACPKYLKDSAPVQCVVQVKNEDTDRMQPIQMHRVFFYLFWLIASSTLLP